MLINYSDIELDLLARIMITEAFNEGELGIIMVGNVVANRVIDNFYTFKNISPILKYSRYASKM